MPEEKETKPSPEVTQRPQMQRIPSQLGIQIDKVDELVAFLSAVRSPDSYNTYRPWLIAPKQLHAINLEPIMPCPQRIRKTITFTDSVSFLAYFKEFRGGLLPQIFSQRISASGIIFMAIMDYDVPGSTIPPQPDENGAVTGHPSHIAAYPMWNNHIAKLALGFHPDYMAFREKNTYQFDQQEFAVFVEENLHVFSKPDSATMLEIAQQLKGHRNVQWEHGKRMSNGELSFGYMETLEAKTSRGEIVVPETIVIKTPIFEGFDEKELKAHFSWRLTDEKKIKFSFRLQTKLDERAAHDEVRARIENETGLKILNVSNACDAICPQPDMLKEEA